jgi:hypothetical protein
VSVECTAKEGKSAYYYPSKSTIRFDFPARPGMPPVKVFWYSAMLEQPDIPGVPKGEILGDLPDRRRKPAVPGNAPKPAMRETQVIGDVFPKDYFENPPEEAPDHKPDGSNGSLFMGSKGMITTGTYGEETRLIPVEKMKDYEFPREFLTRSPGHYRDWIRAAKGGEPSCSHFGVAAPFTEWIALGALALRFEGKLEWDSANMRITNHPEANRALKPAFRKGWSLT